MLATAGFCSDNRVNASSSASISSMRPPMGRSVAANSSLSLPSPPLQTLLAAGVLDQYPPHRLGRCPEEVTPAVPSLGLIPDQPDISFVDKRCGLEGLPGRLS